MLRREEAQLMTRISSKFKAIECLVWTRILLFLFLRHLTSIYVLSETSISTKGLPKLCSDILQIFSMGTETGILHNTRDPASKGFHQCPVAMPWGRDKVPALSIPPGRSSIPTIPSMSQPKRTHWTALFSPSSASGLIWDAEMMFMEKKKHPSSAPGPEGLPCLMCL